MPFLFITLLKNGNANQIAQGDVVQSSGVLIHRYGREEWTFIVLMVFILSIQVSLGL